MAEDPLKPKHIDEYHEDYGPVLWWTNPITEAPYCGSPLDCGFNFKVTVEGAGVKRECVLSGFGGWPGYHEWWTPLPDVDAIAKALGRKA